MILLNPDDVKIFKADTMAIKDDKLEFQQNVTKKLILNESDVFELMEYTNYYDNRVYAVQWRTETYEFPYTMIHAVKISKEQYQQLKEYLKTKGRLNYSTSKIVCVNEDETDSVTRIIKIYMYINKKDSDFADIAKSY